MTWSGQAHRGRGIWTDQNDSAESWGMSGLGRGDGACKGPEVGPRGHGALWLDEDGEGRLAGPVPRDSAGWGRSHGGHCSRDVDEQRCSPVCCTAERVTALPREDGDGGQRRSHCSRPARSNGAWDQRGSWRADGKWSDLEYVLNIEGFWRAVGGRQRRGGLNEQNRGSSLAWGLRDWVDSGAKMEQPGRGSGVGPGGSAPHHAQGESPNPVTWLYTPHRLGAGSTSIPILLSLGSRAWHQPSPSAYRTRCKHSPSLTPPSS